MIRDEPPPPIDDLPDVWEGPAPEETVAEDGPALGDVYGEQSADTPERGDLGSVTAAPDPAAAGPGSAAGRVAPMSRVSMAQSPAAVLTGHVVVPAATIAMVAALLFYLFDVRSVFLPGAGPLKWVGFCFVVATVLIARYARQSGDRDGRTMYTGVLSVVTVVVMVQSPWEAPAAGWLGPLSTGLIIYVVWRFASALTDRLSADLDQPPRPRHRIYGLARLEMERLAEQSDRPVSIYDLGRRARQRAEAEDVEASVADPERAGRDVLRLVLVGLGFFALGEPFLLSGPPAAGQRALGAMIVFLLAAGCVLAAASAYRGVRRAWGAGAQTSATGVAGRVVAAAVALVLVLVVALGLPGVHVQGTGERQPVRADSGVDGPQGDRAPADHEQNGDGDTGDATADDGQGDARGGEDTGGDRGDRGDAGDRGDRRGDSAARGLSSSASPVVSLVAQLGAWLRWPLILLAVLVGAWIAWRFGPVLWRGLGQLFGSGRRALGGWLDRWRAWWSRRRSAAGRARHRDDPLADLGGLEAAAPRPAVLGAYARLLDALDVLDPPRAPEHTPLDLLARWPRPLREARPAAQRLTEIYLQAAYAPDEVSEAARRQALRALVEIRDARDQQAAIEARTR